MPDADHNGSTRPGLLSEVNIFIIFVIYLFSTVLNRSKTPYSEIYILDIFFPADTVNLLLYIIYTFSFKFLSIYFTSFRGLFCV